jgi:hypothetical protein
VSGAAGTRTIPLRRWHLFRLSVTDVRLSDRTLALAVLRSALATRLTSDRSVSLRIPLEPSAVGHASRVYLSWERDVPLPIPELVARPIASARDRRRSWGSSYPSQCCSCPPGFGSSSDPHDPLAVFRTSPRMIFVGGSAVLYTVQISSFVTHNCERQPITAVRRGFWVFRALRAIRSGRFP